MAMAEARDYRPLDLYTPGVAWQEGPAMMVLPRGQAFHGLDVLSYIAEELSLIHI